MRLLRATLHPYALPFVRTLRTARGRFAHRRGWLLALHDDAGNVGWGDAAPWPGFGSDDAGVADALTTLVDDRALEGLDFEDCDQVWRFLDDQRLPPEANHGVELALLDLLSQRGGVRLAQLLGREPRDPRTHQLVVDATPPDRSANVLKLKVGGGLDEDERRVAALRASCHPEVELRLDAGGAWSEAAAHAAIERLARYRIAWLEQPLAADADGAAMARVCQHGEERGITIALDESIRDEASLRAAVSTGAAHAVVLKPMFLGGLGRALALARIAQQAGLSTIVTNALESAVGRTGALHLAAVLDGVHGLSNVLASDVADAPQRVGDRVALPAQAGLGVRPSFGSHAPASAARAAISIPNPIESAALARPDHVAVVSDEGKLSYRQLRDRVVACASHLASRGVESGTRVAYWGEPNLEWVVGFHALAWLGASIAPLPHRVTDGARARLLDSVRPSVRIEARELSSIAPIGTAPPERFWPLDEVRAVLCTSGSSAAPRAVELTTAQWCFSAFGSAIRLGHDPADRWLACLPLHHVGGLSILLRCAFYGTTTVLHPRFDATRVARALDGGEISLVSLVPEMLAAVLDARREQPFPTSLRAILVGGGAMPDVLLRRCQRLRAPVALTWGMTEAASQVATRQPGDLAAERGSGPPLAFARVAERAGRLIVRGPVVAHEHVSGDVGHLDEDGRVHVAGRADDVIISGGEKISPSHVEQVLRSHPAIREAAVVGRVDRRWGERPAALLVASGARPSTEQLRAHCREKLQRFEIPDHFVFCDALPKSELGKVLKGEVRRLLEAHLGASGGRADETELAHAVEQRNRRTARDEAVERDERMLGLHASADLALLATQRVSKADGSLAQPLDLELDVDAVVHANGSLEVGFGVNQRHANAMRLDQHVDAADGGDQHFLVGGVTELEHPREEQDAGAIHLEEARSDSMNERHDDDRR